VVTVASLVLGFMEGVAGAGDRVQGSLADAGGGAAAGEGRGSSPGGAQAPEHPGAGSRVAGWQRDGEFLPAPPAYEVASPGGGAEVIGEGVEDLVSGLVAGGVVDVLKTVEVEHEHGAADG
jgi:hypothetical protein